MIKLHCYYYFWLAFYIALILQSPCLQAQEGIEKTFFPFSWEGDWLGELQIHKAGSDSVQLIPMELHIHPMDSSQNWQWQLVYGGGEERAPRDYELVLTNPPKGHYVIDEKNSILLDCYLFKNVLHSRFEVGKNLLLISYKVEGDEMQFEVVAGNNSSAPTGGKGDIPEVLNYPIGTYQFARLRRK